LDKLHPDFKNILVIHFGQLGDVVLGLPALGAIREKFTDARITLLLGKATGEIAKLANVADDHILVDRVLLRDGNQLRSIAKIFKLVSEVRSRKFDLVIDLHSLSETNLLGFFSGAKHRLFANRESRSLDSLSNFQPRPPVEDKSKHAASRYFNVLLPLGIQNPTPSFRFKPDTADVDHLNAWLFSDIPDGFDGSVGLFPGAGNPSRCWKLENFAELAKRLADTRLRPIIFLGPEEDGLKDDVIKLFPNGTRIIDGLTIAEFIAAVSQLSVFVGNDTGPIHLAACSGVPVVLLLDERAPTTYLPLTADLEIVRNQTIDKITVEDVFHAIKEIICNRPNCPENDKSGGK